MERYLGVNFVGTGPSSYEKRIYRDAVSRRLRNTDMGLSMVEHMIKIPIKRVKIIA
jgi:hypothetical protein